MPMKKEHPVHASRALGLGAGGCSFLLAALCNAAAVDDAQFIDQQLPVTTMQTDEKNQISITMKNTGTDVWTTEGRYCLNAQNATQNWKWDVFYFIWAGRVCLDDGDQIAPEETKTFTFNIEAPNTIGTYNFQWQMVKSGVEFGEMTPAVPISVVSPVFQVKSITHVKRAGGRVDWSPSGNDLIAYDRVGRDAYDDKSKDGCYDVWTMAPDGSNDKCLTCDAPEFANRHLGNPTWHPSGNYIIFQAEKEQVGGCSDLSSPGLGSANELWVMTSDGQDFHRLTHVTDVPFTGVLHPHFSADGQKLSWSEMYEPSGTDPGKVYGYWKLKTADFIEDPANPELANEQEYIPGLDALYENHGFSPDGTKLLFSTNAKIEEETYTLGTNLNIYSLDLTSGSVVALTDGEGSHNEHAIYSPDGTKIVWMTGIDNWNQGTDFWLMNPDGSAKWRVTNFNRAGHPEYVGAFQPQLTAADSSWSPDGLKIAGYVQQDVGGQEGGIYIVELMTESPVTGHYAPPTRLFLRQVFK